MNGKLVLRASRDNGEPIPRTFLETTYLCSLDYADVYETCAVAADDGFIVLEPPASEFQVGAVLPVEGFGAVYVYADNDGSGYSPDVEGLDLCAEAAKTRISRVRHWISEQKSSGFSPSATVSDALCRAESHLIQGAAIESLKESLWAGEQACLEKARQDMLQRSGGARPFLGCFYFPEKQLGPEYAKYVPRYDALFSRVFNYAYVSCGRVFGERPEEVPWDLTQERASRLAAKGMTLSGGVFLMYLNTPQWVKELSYNRLQAIQRNGVLQLVSRYKDVMHTYLVANEAHDWVNDLRLSQEQLVEMTAVVAQATKDADPDARCVVACCEPWGIYAATPEITSRTMKSGFVRPLTTPYKYLRRCVSRNVPFDAVGLQLYFGYGLGFSCHDMFELSLMLDRFSRLGKPIHITEIGYSRGVPGPEGQSSQVGPLLNTPLYWHEPWGERVLADWVESVYTICCSKPYVEAVSWFSFVEAGHMGNLGGLLSPDLAPKEAYYRLERLAQKVSRRTQRALFLKDDCCFFGSSAV